MRVAVLTVDQRGSTEHAATDRVPTTLAGLADLPDVDLLRAFERTAGDEFQGVIDDAGSLVTVVERLLREDTWNIGLGFGEVEEPLPESTRAGRGPAYLHARDAVTAAKSSPWRLRVVGRPAGRAPRRDRPAALGRPCSGAGPRAAGRSRTSRTPACGTTTSPAASPSPSPRSASGPRPPGSSRV